MVGAEDVDVGAVAAVVEILVRRTLAVALAEVAVFEGLVGAVGDVSLLGALIRLRGPERVGAAVGRRGRGGHLVAEAVGAVGLVDHAEGDGEPLEALVGVGVLAVGRVVVDVLVLVAVVDVDDADALVGHEVLHGVVHVLDGVDPPVLVLAAAARRPEEADVDLREDLVREVLDVVEVVLLAVVLAKVLAAVAVRVVVLLQIPPAAVDEGDVVLRDVSGDVLGAVLAAGRLRRAPGLLEEPELGRRADVVEVLLKVDPVLLLDETEPLPARPRLGVVVVALLAERFVVPVDLVGLPRLQELVEDVVAVARDAVAHHRLRKRASVSPGRGGGLLFSATHF